MWDSVAGCGIVWLGVGVCGWVCERVAGSESVWLVCERVAGCVIAWLGV